jgi:hypothetical protein
LDIGLLGFIWGLELGDWNLISSADSTSFSLSVPESSFAAFPFDPIWDPILKPFRKTLWLFRSGSV